MVSSAILDMALSDLEHIEGQNQEWTNFSTQSARNRI